MSTFARKMFKYLQSAQDGSKSPEYRTYALGTARWYASKLIGRGL